MYCVHNVLHAGVLCTQCTLCRYIVYTHSVLHVFVLILYAGELCAVLLCTDTLYMCDIQVYKCTGKQYKCDCTQIYHCLCESVLCESGRDATVYNVLLCTRILCIGFTVYQRLVCTCTVYQGTVYRFYRVPASGLHMCTVSEYVQESKVYL